MSFLDPRLRLELRALSKLQKIVISSVAILSVTILLIAPIVVPYVIERSIFGKTSFDKPSFAIQNMSLSRGGTACFISSTVHNTGNIWMNILSLQLNQSFVWKEANVAPAQYHTTTIPFLSYGAIQCSNISIGQTYAALFTAQFADGVTLNQTTTVLVDNNPNY